MFYILIILINFYFLVKIASQNLYGKSSKFLDLHIQVKIQDFNLSQTFTNLQQLE